MNFEQGSRGACFIQKTKVMKTGIYFASSTGTTERVALELAKTLGVGSEDIHNVAKTAPDTLGQYDMIIMGSPTYGAGELQDDYYDFLEGASALDLKGKKVAVFGDGDESMSDTFCDAVGIIYDKMKDTGADMVGSYNTYPYEFDASKAVPVQGGEAVGLLLDEVNHPDASAGRIAGWVKEITAQ